MARGFSNGDAMSSRWTGMQCKCWMLLSLAGGVIGLGRQV